MEQVLSLTEKCQLSSGGGEEDGGGGGEEGSIDGGCQRGEGLEAERPGRSLNRGGGGGEKGKE